MFRLHFFSAVFFFFFSFFLLFSKYSALCLVIFWFFHIITTVLYASQTWATHFATLNVCMGLLMSATLFGLSSRLFCSILFGFWFVVHFSAKEVKRLETKDTWNFLTVSIRRLCQGWAFKGQEEQIPHMPRVTRINLSGRLQLLLIQNTYGCLIKEIF